MQNLKEAIPTAMNKQKDATDVRLKEVNNELQSLKTLITQRMTPPASAPAGNYLRPSNGNAGPISSPAATPAPTTAGNENADAGAGKLDEKEQQQSKTPVYQDYLSGLNRSSPFGSGMPAKASIPAWQMAMAPKGKDAGSPSSPAANSGEAGGSGSVDGA